MRLMLKQLQPYNILIKMKFLLNNDPNLSPNVTEPNLEHFYIRSSSSQVSKQRNTAARQRFRSEGLKNMRSLRACTQTNREQEKEVTILARVLLKHVLKIFFFLGESHFFPRAPSLSILKKIISASHFSKCQVGASKLHSRRILEQVAQRGHDVSIYGDRQNPTGHGPREPALSRGVGL